MQVRSPGQCQGRQPGGMLTTAGTLVSRASLFLQTTATSRAPLPPLANNLEAPSQKHARQIYSVAFTQAHGTRITSRLVWTSMSCPLCAAPHTMWHAVYSILLVMNRSSCIVGQSEAHSPRWVQPQQHPRAPHPQSLPV